MQTYSFPEFIAIPLNDCIHFAQNNDQDAMLKLIQKFSPLLKKYGRKLVYEDAAEELVLDFIELMHSINLSQLNNHTDGALVNYISRAMYHCYVKRIAVRIDATPDIVSLEELPMEQLKLLSVDPYEDSSVSFCFPAACLSTKEELVIRAVYDYGYTATSLARTLRVSKQNINQIKWCAIKKLQKTYVG